MKFFVVLPFCVASILTADLGQAVAHKKFPEMPARIENRIYRGKPAQIGQFPWYAILYIGNTSRSTCGGSLISDQWVLTAGHCVEDYPGYTVKLGGIKEKLYEEGTIAVYSSEIIIHSDFNSLVQKKDIALIKLPYPVMLSARIHPVQLPQRGDFVGGGQNATACGIGMLGQYGPIVSDVLNYAFLTTITNEECENYYGAPTDEYLCARGDNKENICRGDSGGPLVIYDENNVATHVGVVSFYHHKTGCEGGIPGGYTRTTAYLDWISENSGIII